MGHISSDSPSIANAWAYSLAFPVWACHPWLTLQTPEHSNPCSFLLLIHSEQGTGSPRELWQGPTGVLKRSQLTAPFISIKESLSTVTSEKSKQNK